MEQETAVRAQNMLDAIRGEERFEMFRAGQELLRVAFRSRV